MLTGLTFSGNDLVISGVFTFLLGLTGMTLYIRIKAVLADHARKINDAAVDAVVSEYTRKLRDYDKVISELQAKLSIFEDRLQSQRDLSQYASQARPHVAQAAEPVTITQRPTIENEVNSTTDYILKLLIERPRTSREVQLAIGRTREHTARLMKKLHDLGLISRDINSKPFRYNITNAGRETLVKRAGPASVVV
jgi:hypothetical protein